MKHDASVGANDYLQFESLSQHTSIQTSKAFQLVAHTSSNQMMQWTLKMHEIAVKTKQETLSMHVITVFTLIFLPGTFIAVSPLLSSLPILFLECSNTNHVALDHVQQRRAALGRGRHARLRLGGA